MREVTVPITWHVPHPVLRKGEDVKVIIQGVVYPLVLPRDGVPTHIRMPSQELIYET